MFVSDSTGLVISRADAPGYRRRVEREFSNSDQKNSGAPRWPEAELEQCEPCALPNHLFWTWFVDKSPPNSAVKHKEENVEH